MKLIEQFSQRKMKTDWKTQYIRYRIGRLKHQYWLWNRKNHDYYQIDAYDSFILKNCRPGNTVFFASSGYYLKEIYPEIQVVEMHPVVKTFFPDVYICEKRKDLADILPFKADNFAVINNRAEQWVSADTLFTDHLRNYTRAMNPGCRVFYNVRDTQINGLNRLTTDMEKYFLDWALSLEAELGLKLVWHDINFKKKFPDDQGKYDLAENPDTSNGNIKFIFVYRGAPWEIVQ